MCVRRWLSLLLQQHNERVSFVSYSFVAVGAQIVSQVDLVCALPSLH